MFAVIKTGGKQYRVVANDEIIVMTLAGEAGEKITFADVLMLADGDNIQLGAPMVAGAKVIGEIVNADAMQLYAGMDVGTAKLPVAERRGIPHHMFDVLRVTDEAAVADYQAQARSVISDINERGHLAILVGGSGLYVSSVLFDFEFPGHDDVIRERLEKEMEELGPGVLFQRLKELAPEAAERIDQQKADDRGGQPENPNGAAGATGHCPTRAAGPFRRRDDCAAACCASSGQCLSGHAPHVRVEQISLSAIEAARDAYVNGQLRERLSKFHNDVDCAFWQWNDVWLSEGFRSFDIRDICRDITAPVLALQGVDDAYGTLAQIEEIAKIKMEDLNANDIDAASKIIAGTARSMGITTNG